MKKYVSFILILILLIGSFYYADKVSNFIINKSPLMKTLKSNKDKYEIKSVDAIVSDEYIIPGIEGKKVSEIESYYNMKKYNTFVSDKLIYKSIIPSISLEKNKDLIFGEKSYAFWYTTKLLYYYDRQEYNNYIELYNSKLNSKINSNLSEIIYYIISEEYDQALGLLKKAIKGQKGLGYIMCLYYKIICLEKLDREVELNEAVGEISKYSSEIKYVKKIKEKYLAD